MIREFFNQVGQALVDVWTEFIFYFPHPPKPKVKMSFAKPSRKANSAAQKAQDLRLNLTPREEALYSWLEEESILRPHESIEKRLAALEVVAIARSNGVAMREQTCLKPPDGWWCSRDRHHDGPCAARAL